MPIYGEFARIYASGDYPEFSRRMGEHLPSALKALGFSPAAVLDIACGEGTFAVAASRLGYLVTGLDISEEMLGFARRRAQKAGAEVSFVRGDMRRLPFARRFDLVTCWFDSLNYILDADEIKTVFHGVHGALRPGGLFIFDMNTIRGLSENWRENVCNVETDTDGVFEVHRQEYDLETGLAEMRITGFIREGNGWRRIDEEHRERGYSRKQVQKSLKASGFQVLASWGSFRDRSEPSTESPRIWYVGKAVVR